MPSRQRVVIAGAGFAGLHVAKGLEGKADVTLVAPTKQFVYLPLIHEVLSENVLPRETSRELEKALPETRHVFGRAAAVEGDALVTTAGERLEFDRLVVAVGAEPNDFGVPGVLEHALTFYSVGDALRANGTLKQRAADVRPTEERPLRVVVAGASFTGVEVAGEVAELLRKNDVPHRIILLDALPEIFPHQSDRFRRGVRKGLDRLDLELRTEQRITEIAPDAVTVRGPEGKEETLASDVTFWCAGVKARTVEGVDPRVTPTLQSQEREDVFVLGDAATFPRDMGVPKLAQTAEEQASVVVHNILNPHQKRVYEPNVKGLIVSIGHNYAVAELSGGAVFAGAVPWHVKRALYKAKIAFT